MVKSVEPEHLSRFDSSLRVLQVIPGEPKGNSMIFAHRQVSSLQREGVQCCIFYLRSRTSIGALFGEYWRLRRAIAEFRPDLIHAHFGTMTGFLCALVGRVPLLITFRGSDLNPVPSISRSRSMFGRLLSNAAALRASAIICVSEQTKQRLWWRKRKAKVVPSGVDLEKFRPIPQETARAALGWKHGQPTVLFNAGREPMVKRLDLAEASIREAGKEISDLQFMVLRGDVDSELMPVYLNAADCILFTSDWEGSPNVVKEALACNARVVSVDVGDVRERLADVDGCALVSRDPHVIGRTLASLLRQHGRSNGREHVLSLSETAIARQIVDLYHHVATPRASRSAVSTVSSPST